MIRILCECTSRFIKLVHLDAYRFVDTVNPALIRALKPIALHLRRSLTWNHGIEMTENPLISQVLDIEVYL